MEYTDVMFLEKIPLSGAESGGVCRNQLGLQRRTHPALPKLAINQAIKI